MEVKEDIELCKFDGVEAVAVYSGGLTSLVKQDPKWRKANEATCKALGMNVEILKLSEIAEQLKDAFLITVIIDGPLSGRILQYGNYNDGKWYEIGQTCGYA